MNLFRRDPFSHFLKGAAHQFARRSEAPISALVGAILIACALVTRPFLAAAPNDTVESSTAHFILKLEGVNPQETALFLEAAYGQLTNFFKVLPDHKASVSIFRNRETYDREIARLRQVFFIEKGQGIENGIYLRETSTVYCVANPRPYEYRFYLLQMLALQYQDLIRPHGLKQGATPCLYGLANYFAMHNWDGKVLQVGIVPPISTLDLPAAALATFGKRTGPYLQSIVDGKMPIDGAIAWGLISFLLSYDRMHFDIWRQALNNNVDESYAWNKQFGPVTSKFELDFGSWLESHAQPWQVLAGDWQPWGNEIEGQAEPDHYGIAILKRVPLSLKVEMDGPAKNAAVGIVLGYRNSKDFKLLRHGDENVWELLQFDGSKYLLLDRPTLTSTSQRDSIAIEPGIEKTRLNVNGRWLQVTNSNGSVGILVGGCNRRFLCEWK